MSNDNVRKIVSGIATAVIMLIAMMICFAFGYMPPDPPIPESGVEVALGYTDVGFGDAENPNQQAASTPAPPSQASNEQYATQSTEESVGMPSKVTPKPSVEKPQPQETAKTVAQEQPKQPVIDDKAIYRGSKKNNNTDGGSKGNTTGKGAMGKDNGNPNATSQVGNGGNGGGAGPSVSFRSGRKGDKLSKPKYSSDREGKIVIKVYVDRQGNVVRVDKNPQQHTTIFDKELIGQCIIAARNSKFKPSPDAPETEWGTITYVFDRTN